MAGKHAAVKKQRRPRWKVVLVALAVLTVIGSISRCAKKDDPATESVSVESIVELCRQSTEKNFPDHNSVVFDAEKKQLVISVWIDDMDAAAASAMADTTGTRESWETLKNDLLSACSSWQSRFDSEGFSDVKVTMFLLNPSNRDNALIAVSDGRVFYDVVEEYLSR